MLLYICFTVFGIENGSQSTSPSMNSCSLFYPYEGHNYHLRICQQNLLTRLLTPFYSQRALIVFPLCPDDLNRPFSEAKNRKSAFLSSLEFAEGTKVETGHVPSHLILEKSFFSQFA